MVTEPTTEMKINATVRLILVRTDKRLKNDGCSRIDMANILFINPGAPGGGNTHNSLSADHTAGLSKSARGVIKASPCANPQLTAASKIKTLPYEYQGESCGWRRIIRSGRRGAIAGVIDRCCDHFQACPCQKTCICPLWTGPNKQIPLRKLDSLVTW